MPMTQQTQALSRPAAARPVRATVARRRTANLALILGVMATSISLGVFVGDIGRALLGH